MHVRDAGAEDVEALTEALLAAMNWGETRATREQVLADPHLSHYVDGWPRPGDSGVVAVEDGAAVGAAWWRTFDADDAGYGYVAPDVPEVSIGVQATHRGRGIGTALLRALVERAAAEGRRALSLSVEDGNAARRLYERTGFVVVGRNGGSDTMLLSL